MGKDAELEISDLVFPSYENASLVNISFVQLTDGMLTISFEISGSGD
jgi:hypothetical protein